MTWPPLRPRLAFPARSWGSPQSVTASCAPVSGCPPRLVRGPHRGLASPVLRTGTPCLRCSVGYTGKGAPRGRRGCIRQPHPGRAPEAGSSPFWPGCPGRHVGPKGKLTQGTLIVPSPLREGGAGWALGAEHSWGDRQAPAAHPVCEGVPPSVPPGTPAVPGHPSSQTLSLLSFLGAGAFLGASHPVPFVECKHETGVRNLCGRLQCSRPSSALRETWGAALAWPSDTWLQGGRLLGLLGRQGLINPSCSRGARGLGGLAA